MNSPDSESALSRRAFLAGTGAVLGAGAVAGCASVAGNAVQPLADSRADAGSAGANAANPVASTGTPRTTVPGEFFETPMRASTNGLLSTTLRVAETEVGVGTQLVRASTYEGMYPGPTLEVRPGDTLKIKLANDLNENTNLHTHGLHVSPSNNSDNVLLTVKPHEPFDYEFKIPKDHPAGTLWYHAHFHTLADKQVFGGEFGLMVVRGDFDDLPGLAGRRERVMVVSQIEIKGDAVVDGANSSLAKQVTLVNGRYQPDVDIEPGEVQRWRICNASSVFLRLGLDGHQLNTVAIDGNSLVATKAMDLIEIPPGGRADVLIQGGAPGRYEFRSLTWDTSGAFYSTNMVPVPDTIVRLVSKGTATATAAPLPNALLPMVDLRDVPIDRRRVFRLEEREPRHVGPNDRFNYFINGTQFDHNVVNETMKLGATEEWEFVNLTYEPHPLHIHVNPFQVVMINGQPSNENHYRDTATVPPFGSIVIRHQFLDYPGKFVMHCHILFHEDHGMMQLLEVVA